MYLYFKFNFAEPGLFLYLDVFLHFDPSILSVIFCFTYKIDLSLHWQLAIL